MICTGSIMQEQMDNLMSEGELKYDYLFSKMETFIKECGYDWTVAEIIEEYKKKEQGYYISHTANIVINEFKSLLDELF